MLTRRLPLNVVDVDAVADHYYNDNSNDNNDDIINNNNNNNEEPTQHVVDPTLFSAVTASSRRPRPRKTKQPL